MNNNSFTNNTTSNNLARTVVGVTVKVAKGSSAAYAPVSSAIGASRPAATFGDAL